MIRRTALALVVLTACAEKLPEAHVMPLVGAERSFEREVAELGVEKGFLANIAPDAVLLRPGPIPAAEALSRTPPALALTWEPSFAEIAASGDLGYTTGPFQARRSDLVTVNYGHYVSVWRKDDDKWHLVIDGGAPHPPPLDLPDRFSYAAPRVSERSADPAAELKSLRAVEDQLIAEFADTGRGLPALLSVAAPDLRYFPPGSFPVTGKDAVQTAMLARADALTYTPKGSAVSAAGDLGYVYGEATRQPGPQAPVERGGYLRIWRRAADGRWQVALDLTITAPPPKDAPAADAAPAPEPAPKDTP
jgi:ketosteroid isomerase-like protein